MLAKWDAAIRARTFVGWIAFRAVCGFLVALGLFALVGAKFKDDFWLGVAMATICVPILARELGILPNRADD